MPELAEIARNDPCPCGSGKRYKHCCGSVIDAAKTPPFDAIALMASALAEQQARRLDAAERLYREALAVDPDLADALHMLGVVRYERGAYSEARALIMRALDLTGWRFPSYRHNLALVVGKASQQGAVFAGQLAEQRRWYESHRALGKPSREATPRVAVVIPAHNHARYIEAALESVFAQTYANLEIVVIDDGSSDATLDAARRALQRSPFPHRLVSRDNRGSAATINEAISPCSTPYFNILNSDDAFAPQRIATLVEQVARRGASWGFSDVDFIDALDAPIDLLRDPRAYSIRCAISGMPSGRSIGFALLAFNVIVSSGNLFCSRHLWQTVGGFRDLRYNHDWDFGLRALWHEEPVFVRKRLYRYRLHAANTISESTSAPRDEAQAIIGEYLTRAIDEVPPNPVAPSSHAWGADFAVSVLQGGVAEACDTPVLRRLVSLADPAHVAEEL